MYYSDILGAVFTDIPQAYLPTLRASSDALTMAVPLAGLSTLRASASNVFLLFRAADARDLVRGWPFAPEDQGDAHLNERHAAN